LHQIPPHLALARPQERRERKLLFTPIPTTKMIDLGGNGFHLMRKV